jgi:V8-like Glu-specific endopeptidase
MRRIILSIALLGAGCGGVRISGAPDSKGPDMSGVLAVIGRFSIASACPIGPNRILTAAHVADFRPFDSSVPLYPYPYSNEAGDSGVMAPVGVKTIQDLSEYIPGEPLTHYYSVAEKGPAKGDTVYWQQYNFENKDRAFSRVTKKSEVLRLISGHLILREEIAHGASGGCVFNGSGEVVGIVSFGKELGSGKGEVGGVVSIYGDWLDAQFRADEAKRKWMEALEPEITITEIP